MHSPPEILSSGCNSRPSLRFDSHFCNQLDNQSVISMPPDGVRPKDFVYQGSLTLVAGEPAWPYRSSTDTSAPIPAMPPRRRRGKIRIRRPIPAAWMETIAVPLAPTIQPSCSAARPQLTNKTRQTSVQPLIDTRYPFRILGSWQAALQAILRRCVRAPSRDLRGYPREASFHWAAGCMTAGRRCLQLVMPYWTGWSARLALHCSVTTACMQGNGSHAISRLHFLLVLGHRERS